MANSEYTKISTISRRELSLDCSLPWIKDHNEPSAKKALTLELKYPSPAVNPLCQILHDSHDTKFSNIKYYELFLDFETHHLYDDPITDRYIKTLLG